MVKNNNVDGSKRNLFKVSNKDTRTLLMFLLCLALHLTYFLQCFTSCIFNFKCFFFVSVDVSILNLVFLISCSNLIHSGTALFYLLVTSVFSSKAGNPPLWRNSLPTSLRCLCNSSHKYNAVGSQWFDDTFKFSNFPTTWKWFARKASNPRNGYWGLPNDYHLMKSSYKD